MLYRKVNIKKLKSLPIPTYSTYNSFPRQVIHTYSFSAVYHAVSNFSLFSLILLRKGVNMSLKANAFCQILPLNFHSQCFSQTAFFPKTIFPMLLRHRFL